MLLVQFPENDIDRPIVVCALYNGQGEGGSLPRSGGAAASGNEPEKLYKPAHDHGVSALGLLIHAADNYRGSLRGAGAELRTDACGAVRAKAGLLVTSYVLRHDAAQREPAGDNAAGIALMKQAVLLGDTFSTAATTHQTVAYASHIGASAPNASELDDQAAPLKALLASVSGMQEELPHTKDAIIAVAAKAGLGLIAGQDLQLANGETATLMSGQDTQFVGGGKLRLHTGQAIGVLGGAVKAGQDDTGVQLIAAQGAIEVQAQSDVLQVQARDEVNVISANAHVDWAAAKNRRLSTAGGANITIEGGNITIQCPGKITVYAGKKSFLAPDRLAYPFPGLPNAICVECLKKSIAAGLAFTSVE